jgi:hypothetical protein
MPLDPPLAPPRSILRSHLAEQYRLPDGDAGSPPVSRLALLGAILGNAVLWLLLYRLGEWIVDAF